MALPLPSSLKGNIVMSKKFINSSKFALRFDRVHPGSLFTIVAEPNRGIRRSSDTTVYRKAQEHEGFYATAHDDKSKVACLMPNDMVQPVRVDKDNK